MLNWAALVAPFALLLPVVMTGDDGERHGVGAGKLPVEARPFEADKGLQGIDPWTGERLPHQVRIEQRVVIRISPARPRSATGDIQPVAIGAKMKERGMGKCIGMKDIVAVQTGSANKLILFMRNRQMISAKLEKACLARDFYSGFYVEPSKDGNLCIDRDQLQSRSGTKCEVSKFYRLEQQRD